MKSIFFQTSNEAINYTRSNEGKGFILFSNIDLIAELSKEISSNVVLCSTAGEYSIKGYKNGVISGFEYNLSDAETVEILYPPIKSITNLKSSYNKVKNNENAFGLLLCDGLTGMEETIITTLHFMDDKFKIIGGSAGDNLKFKETLIYIGPKRVHSVIVFFNLKSRIHMVKENIYVPTGIRLLVTESDAISRTVKSFNRNPASSEYARALNIKESDLSNYFMNNPLGKLYKDEIFIASPMKVNADKSITFYCQLMPNTFVEVLKPIDPIEQVNSTLRSIPFKPSFLLAINCILRSLKFQQENLWNDIDKKILTYCPNTTGFISYGEQFYKAHANQTMVILAVQ
ncbi:FIST C-terminal domain-containing protein [Clostridium sp. YIM B02505]|uniref:FIST C-terminal domain-containing protein n=1 Tax=Clostridium yunnanense TaxID=2800325 RepID=A0ABS1ER86_9CLOT|nr:FIST N-terminal domain-containing protein [Clostridium yunnanense]MBK1811920.1 FIST C-terminal domain-containing protein [Clostridium yunnanense]